MGRKYSYNFWEGIIMDFLRSPAIRIFPFLQGIKKLGPRDSRFVDDSWFSQCDWTSLRLCDILWGIPGSQIQDLSWKSSVLSGSATIASTAAVVFEDCFCSISDWWGIFSHRVTHGRNNDDSATDCGGLCWIPDAKHGAESYWPT